MKNDLRISFLLPSFDDGGVEKVTINLASELKNQGYLVEFVCFNKKGPFLSELDADMGIYELGTSRAAESIPKLIKYLKLKKPDILVSAKHYINTSVLIAKALSRTSTKVIVSGHGMYNGNKSGALPFLMRRLYPKADAIIAVSKGVANNISEVANIPREQIKVIYNPVITDGFLKMYESTNSVNKAFEKQLVSIGRLSKEKDFVTLIHAFKLLKNTVPSKLTIVGEGLERAKLESLIKELNLEEYVSLPGYTGNPLEFLKGADAFILSSVTEGLPTVLIEALYTGLPIVSTDCPSGPEEILEGGKFGVLTPVGNAEALAKGIEKALSNPPDPNTQQIRALDFTSEKAIAGYKQLLTSLHTERKK
ncbi:glycosyltransferase [Mesobacillus harenae]|uniref:glycosyltransferase n=1 Tax=Mesobacillus harenae TaxID=2213203 RepID=UPI001580B911|nr:glycosyltransferase [Mesobacillus harenae]